MNSKKLVLALFTLLSNLAHAQVTDLSIDPKTGGFDQVAADGSNLRAILVDSPLVEEVVPYGPYISYVVFKQSGGGFFVSRASEEAIEAVPLLCKTKWEWRAFKQDIMSNKVTTEWEDAKPRTPYQLLRATEVNPLTKKSEEMGGSRCKDAFRFSRTYTTGGVNNFLHSVVVSHVKPQAMLTKSKFIKFPTQDVSPADGVLPGDLVSTSKFPDQRSVTAWSIALCDLRGGRIRMYLPKRRPAVITEMEEISGIEIQSRFTSNAPNEPYFVECGGPKGFLLRGDADGTQIRLMFQAGRTIDSL